MDTEIWRPIVGYEGLYSVSSLGRVRREASVIRIADHLGGRARLPQRDVTLRGNRDGYVICDLWKDASRTTAYVHALVATSFIGPRDAGQEVNHVNGDKTHNRVENLEYVTKSKNIRHAFANNLKPRGAAHHKAKLTLDAVHVIRATNITPVGVAATLAARYGVSIVTIGKVHRRETWSHVT